MQTLARIMLDVTLNPEGHLLLPELYQALFPRGPLSVAAFPEISSKYKP